MNIRHFDIQTPNTQTPDDRSWTRLWNGNWRLSECWNDGLTNMSERAFEVDCFLSILDEIDKPQVTMFELGAGWGDWCLALDGVLKHKLVRTSTQECYCIAVEADMRHCQWALEHFEACSINGTVLYGAVSGRDGHARFNVYNDPKQYNQRLSFEDLNSCRVIRDVYNLLRGSTTCVPTYTIDTLISRCGPADIVQMDIQGAELKAIEGAKHAINNNLVDYFLIGTHKRKYNEALKEMLEPYYECVVNLIPRSSRTFNGYTIRCVDGLMLFKRRTIK